MTRLRDHLYSSLKTACATTDARRNPGEAIHAGAGGLEG
jgi:hypothetical protein